MKRLLLIFISSACLTFIPAEARACTCAEYNVPVCAAYWRADAVFTGLLLDITPVEKSEVRMPTVMLHFIVEQSFRGVGGNRVEVETLHGTSCDIPFGKGARYLVYASRDKSTNQLFAGACDRTTHLDNAADDLNYIQSVTQQQAKETVLGRLLHGRFDPIPGIKITVNGNYKTLETKTDDKGDFSVLVPGPGNYTVRVFLPYGAYVEGYGLTDRAKQKATDVSTTLEYEVKLEKNQCQYRQLDVVKVDVNATAAVSGNVLTASGSAVNLGYVYLVHATISDKTRSEKLDKNGSFKFEGITAGEYYLVLNPQNAAPGEYDAPYPRTYYPNAPEVSAATTIVVTESAKLENLTLRVGRRLKERLVNGKVVWPDGTAPRDCHVSLYADERFVRLLKLDDTGRFDFKVYGDFKYAIRAQVLGRQLRGQSERITITDKNSTRLKIVLKRIE